MALILPNKKIQSHIRLHKNLNTTPTDIPIRHYKYFSSFDLNLSAAPVHPTLKWKVLHFLRKAKVLRKLRFDDENVESLRIFNEYRQVLTKQAQSLNSLSQSIQSHDDEDRFSMRIKKPLIKLKALHKYNNFPLSSREFLLTQTHIKTLELVSSKFAGEDFKRLITYLITRDSSFSSLEELVLSFRLSRIKEDIFEELPDLVQRKNIKSVRLAFLYAKRLPNFFLKIPESGMSKVKEMRVLVENNFNATDFLPAVLAFQNLEYLSLANSFTGFYLHRSDCYNWKALEKLNNLKSFSLELSDYNYESESLALLLGSIGLPVRLETLRFCLMLVPLDDIWENYNECCQKFVKEVSQLENLSSLNMMMTSSSEQSEKLEEFGNLLCTALRGKGKLKEVFLNFSEPRQGQHIAKYEGVLDIMPLIYSLKSSSHCLEKLEIRTIKGKLKDFYETISFEKMRKVNITVNEVVEPNYSFKKLLESFHTEALLNLELKFPTFLSTRDLVLLSRFKKLDTLNLHLLGDQVEEFLVVLKQVLVNLPFIRDVSLRLLDLDMKKERQIEDIMITMTNKKKLRIIRILTKYFKYSFDRNVDGKFGEEDSNGYKKMLLFN